MGVAVSPENFQLLVQLRHVARQGIRHLKGWRESLGSLREHPGEVLPGVAPAGEEQRDPLPLPRRRHDAGGEQSRALPRARRGFIASTWLRVFDFPLRGALKGLALASARIFMLVSSTIRLAPLGGSTLRRAGRIPSATSATIRTASRPAAAPSQTRLQPLQPIPGNATAVLQLRAHHRRRAGIVLFLAHLGRRLRLETSPHRLQRRRSNS